jgi:hypothetical protein
MYSVCIKPIEFFQPDPSNPHKEFPQEELRLLGESLRKKQHVPLIARKSGVLVDGERRWRAAKMQSERAVRDSRCSRSRSKEFYDDHSASAIYAGEKAHATGRSAAGTPQTRQRVN